MRFRPAINCGTIYSRVWLPAAEGSYRPPGGFRWQNERMELEVDCYSGRKADERPVRFRLAGHEYFVEELLDQWYGQDDEFFKVRADDGNLYILRHERSSPVSGWHLVSSRSLP